MSELGDEGRVPEVNEPGPEVGGGVHRAGHEEGGAEEGEGLRGGLHEDVEVAVDPQQPLDGLGHLEVGEFGGHLEVQHLPPQVPAEHALQQLHVAP